MTDTEINILIVDDAPEHIRTAGVILKSLGYPIRVASSGRQALALVGKQAPTVVLLDISLGDMDGFEVCRQIRQRPSCQDTAIIFVTADQGEESIQKGFASGGQDYVVKPFVPSELLARTGAHLRLAAQARELKASYQELDQFCRTVSHDLKSPLMVIRQLAAALVESVPAKSRGEAGIPARLLDEKCGQTIRMIERLLEFSRMTRMECHLHLIDPVPIFRQVYAELSSLEPQRDISFHIEPLPQILADETLFTLLVQNILGNAVKFTRKTPSAQIRVTTASSPGHLQIIVCDNGAGFDMQYHDKLFHVFERLHSASEFEGSGVGLAIAARIMRTHGGSIDITSKLQKGCRVVLDFPAPIILE